MSCIGIAVQNIYSPNNNHSELALQQPPTRLYDSVIKELLCMQT
jgi:hypothetical protein